MRAGSRGRSRRPSPAAAAPQPSTASELLSPSAPAPSRPTHRQLGWADPAKGIAIAMVVAYHATLYLQSIGVDAVLGRAKAAFELYPMPLFFLISGMAASSHRQMHFRAFWWRRLVPLLYLYVFWSVLRTVFYLVVPGLNGELGELPATGPWVLPLLLVWPSSSYWFLHALLVFTLLRWVIARWPVWVQLVSSGVVASLFSAHLLDAVNLGLNRIGSLFFFFVAGALLARPLKAFVVRSRWWHLMLLIGALFVVTGLLVVGLRAVPPLVLIGQAAAVLVVIIACAWLRDGLLRSLLTSLGQDTLKLYLLHLYIIVPAVAFLALFKPAWTRPVDVAIQAGLAVGALAATVLLARLTSRLRWLYTPPGWLRARTGPRSTTRPRRGLTTNSH